MGFLRTPYLPSARMHFANHQACMARRMKGTERVEDFEERYVVMVDFSHRAALQGEDSALQATFVATCSPRRGPHRMWVYVSAKAGKMKVASEVVAAVLRIARVSQNGTAQPSEMLSLYRRWAEEAFMLRVATRERQALPEHDRRPRRSQFCRYRERSRQRRRWKVATAWFSVSGEPIGGLA